MSVCDTLCVFGRAPEDDFWEKKILGMDTNLEETNYVPSWKAVAEWEKNHEPLPQIIPVHETLPNGVRRS